MSTLPKKSCVGFTLVELIIVIVVLGIVSTYVVMRNFSVADATLPSQAQKMASDIRHAQTLATTWGKSLQLNTTAGTNGVYSVSCVIATAGVSPCGVSPVINPATGNSFSVELQKGVALAGTATLSFNSLGQPNASASYTLTSGGGTKTISVAALTGHVTVSP